MKKNVFASRLKQLRTSSGLSMQVIANAVGLKNKSSIALFESENNTPSADALVALADLFYVSLDYLVGRTDDPRYDEFLNKAEETELNSILLMGLTHKFCPPAYVDPLSRKKYYSHETRVKILHLIRKLDEVMAEESTLYRQCQEIYFKEHKVVEELAIQTRIILEKSGLLAPLFDELDNAAKNRRQIAHELYALFNPPTLTQKSNEDLSNQGDNGPPNLIFW